MNEIFEVFPNGFSQKNKIKQKSYFYLFLVFPRKKMLSLCSSAQISKQKLKFHNEIQ